MKRRTLVWGLLLLGCLAFWVSLLWGLASALGAR